MRFVRWDYVALCVAMSIVFGLEMLGVFNHKYVTITYIIRTYMPRWMASMIYGWIGWHFLWRH